MDLSKITTVWTDYAKHLKIELIHKERTVNDVTQTQYAINYTNATEFFSWIAFSQQSAEKNTGITSVIIELKDKLNLDNFKIETTTPIENPSEFEIKILDALKTFKGTAISQNNTFLKIDTQHIFDTKEEFEAVKNLLAELKTY